MLYFEIKQHRLKGTKAKNLLGQKKTTILTNSGIYFFGGKTSVKHQSQKFAHHSKTNKNKRNYGTPYLNEYTNESNRSTYSKELNEKLKCLFHNLLFFFISFTKLLLFL